MKITLFFHNYRNTLHGRGTNLDSIGLLFTSLYPGFLNKCIEIVGAAVTPSTTMVGKLVSITWLTIRSTVNVLIYLDVGDGWWIPDDILYLPSGKRLHSYGKIHHFLAGKINYYIMAMFNSYFDITRPGKHIQIICDPLSDGCHMAEEKWSFSRECLAYRTTKYSP